MELKYELMYAPMPDDFCQWYPYLREENMVGENPNWIGWLKKAVQDKIPGLSNIYFTAKDIEREKWAGVTWCCFPARLPELVHFGWFLVDEAYRGLGIGREILKMCEQWWREAGARAIMLGTTLHLTPAHGMYLRRGWKDVLIDPSNGYCFMVREPEGHYDTYFRRSGEITIREIQPEDFLCVDYLLNRKTLLSRIFPLDSLSSKRIISFEVNWEDYLALVARRKDVVLGIAVAEETSEGWLVDVFSPDKKVGEVLLRKLMSRLEGDVYTKVASRDKGKVALFKRNGFVVKDEFLLNAEGELEQFVILLRRER